LRVNLQYFIPGGLEPGADDCDPLDRLRGRRGARISGARLESDRMGSKALARLDRDVLVQPGVRTFMLLLGINDTAWPGTPFDPHAPAASFDAMIAGYKAVVARAHAGRVRMIGATLTPFADALPGTPLGSTSYSTAKTRSATESMTGSGPRAPSMAWWIITASSPSRTRQTISRPRMTAAITFTPAMPVKRRWPTPSTSTI